MLRNVPRRIKCFIFFAVCIYIKFLVGCLLGGWLGWLVGWLLLAFTVSYDACSCKGTCHYPRNDERKVKHILSWQKKVEIILDQLTSTNGKKSLLTHTHTEPLVFSAKRCQPIGDWHLWLHWSMHAFVLLPFLHHHSVLHFIKCMYKDRISISSQLLTSPTHEWWWWWRILSSLCTM